MLRTVTRPPLPRSLSDAQVYARQLLLKWHGYPLWVCEPYGFNDPPLPRSARGVPQARSSQVSTLKPRSRFLERRRARQHEFWCGSCSQSHRPQDAEKNGPKLLRIFSALLMGSSKTNRPSPGFMLRYSLSGNPSSHHSNYMFG